MLKKRGFEKGSPADVVIVNTCAVTAEAGRKSRQLINRLKAENPGALLAVCGCYSQAEEIEADIVFGTNDKEAFAEAIEKGVRERNVDDPFKRLEFEELPAGAVDGRTRAMLKIQDGCVNFCSYCIIPYTRGRLRSLSIEKAAAETERIAAEGFKELVITGIEIASYGLDLPGKPKLEDVLCACSEKAGDMRIRLGSLEPRAVTEEFCEKLARCGNFCNHFHLALQSGCDRTLKAMNRKYSCDEFLEVCYRIRKYFPDCGLTCDLITGFPGETEEDFEQTLEFIRKCAFSGMHIFPYSRRPGTPADRMSGQCSNAVKNGRAKRAIEAAEQMRKEFMESFVGKELEVLAEKGGKGHSSNYLSVVIKGQWAVNELMRVKIEGIEGENLYGTCV